MSDFLLELRSEEIPARMQARAREDLAKLFAAELARAGINEVETITYATPRRLALIARGLPTGTAAVAEETKGPKVGAPPQALEGFLRKTGLAADQLTIRDGVYFAVIERAGRPTTDVLAEAIPAIIRAFPWPKSMRWGAESRSMESLRWVRPLQGIVAVFDAAVVPCSVAGIAAGRDTVGHRFMAPGAISIDSAATYVEQLRAAHVIVDQDERANIIAVGAKMAARKAGLTLIEDAGLLAENAGLTEWPVPLLGRFDAAFLSVPPEVIQLTARVNQKYFVCADADGKLANAFICTANVDADDDGAAIVEGNRKVLAARLSDARFFYETDLKVPLEAQAEKLDRIVFHEKLGTVADKVERVAKLARWLMEEGIVPSSAPLPEREGLGVGRPVAADDLSTSQPTPDPSLPGKGETRATLATLAERAAQLCKADLVTGMVGEFPELQGVMGGYYAAAQGEDPRVAASIRDHYKPVGQGDDVPADPVTVAVSLADKLDTIVAFFAIDEKPTGSKDPFALRRAALGVIALLFANKTRIGLSRLKRIAMELLVGQQFAQSDQIRDLVGPQSADVKWSFQKIYGQEPQLMANVKGQMIPLRLSEAEQLRINVMFHVLMNEARVDNPVLDFFADRLKVQQREAGVRHDLIDAVFALGGEDDLVRLLARVRALQAFIGTEDGANLLAGYKRAANILKKEGSPLPAREGSGVGSPAAAGDLPTSPPTPSPSLAGRGASLGYTPEPAEAALIAALDAAEPRAEAAVVAEDFEVAMAALAQLRAPIDAFFEHVTVNDTDPARRAARLALLARFRDAVHRVADFSRIES